MKILRAVLFAAGFCLCAWPLAGNILSDRRQENAIAGCGQIREQDQAADFREEKLRAEQYNRELFESSRDPEARRNTEEYEDLLDSAGTGMMGVLEIPEIDVRLPVYHGTGQEVLAAGAGHLEGSSLPVGGENTRCVLTGHRGLPGSRLFTRLDELDTGDLFFLTVCGETLVYRVTGTEVIRPDETDALRIQEGKDLVSLVTCTPYGINTHRLVVTGERDAGSTVLPETVRAGIPSFRELLLTSLPFLGLFAGIALWAPRGNRRKIPASEGRQKDKRERRGRRMKTLPAERK